MKKSDKREPLVVVGEIKSGEIVGGLSHLLRAVPSAVKRWPDGNIDITVAQREDTRRARANRYMWGVVLKMMAAESGDTAEALHELMKLRHNFTVVVDPDGEEVKVAKSTAHLTISEFSEYLEKIMLDGSEWLGIIFPEPRSEDDWRK